MISDSKNYCEEIKTRLIRQSDWQHGGTLDRVATGCVSGELAHVGRYSNCGKQSGK